MNGDAKPAVALKDAALRILLGSAGGGVGVALVFVAMEIARSNPAEAFDLLKNWGDNFIFVVVLLTMGSRWMNMQHETAGKTAAAVASFVAEQRRVADSMNTIAESVTYVSQKDDHRAAATDAAIGFVAQQNETISRNLKDIAVDLQEIKARLPK